MSDEGDDGGGTASGNGGNYFKGIVDETLRTLVWSSNQLLRPIPLPIEQPEDATNQLSRLRVATVSFDIRSLEAAPSSSSRSFREISFGDIENARRTTPDHWLVERTSTLSHWDFDTIRLYGFPEGFEFSSYREFFVEQVKRAIRDDCHAICFGELAYPHPGMNPDEIDSHLAFEAQLQQLADSGEIMIVGGSFHRVDTQTNECPIFVPGGRRSAARLDRAVPGRMEPEDHDRHPYFYTKRNSASSSFPREGVRRPVGSFLPFYRTSFGNVAVIICLDAMDPALVLRFMAWNSYDVGRRAKTRQNVIFLPSYSSNDYGLGMAKLIGRLTGAAIVYVDQEVGDAGVTHRVRGTDGIHLRSSAVFNRDDWVLPQELMDGDRHRFGTYRLYDIDRSDAAKRDMELADGLRNTDVMREIVKRETPIEAQR